MVVTYSVTLNTINMALIKCTECGEMISDKAWYAHIVEHQ